MSPLLRTHTRLDLPKGADVLAFMEAQGGPLFAWSQGLGRPSFYASGSVSTVELNGESVYERLVEKCSRDVEHVARSAGASVNCRLPLWLGSVACLPGGHRRQETGGIWGGWPDARFWVPRLLVVDDGLGNRTSVVTTAEETEPRPTGAPESTLAQCPPPCSTRLDYEQQVALAVQSVVNNDTPLKKVVVARARRLHLRSAPSLAQLYTAAAAREPHATHVLVHWPGAGTLLSSTPERLVSVDGLELATEALAGTVSRGHGAADRLLQSRKDLHEHALVVEHLEAALTSVCERLVVPPVPRIRSLSSLLHLATPVTGRSKRPIHLLELAALLHPTPAIVGTPSQLASRWLAAHEGLDRGHYAGTAGWFDADGNGELVIAIRSALIRGSAAWAFAGAGIVRGSNPALEWLETEAKLATAMAFFQQDSGQEVAA